jgi:hypothetical protein
MSYKTWGFKENPFQTTALPPDERGDKLIAGRDRDIDVLLRRLNNQPQIVTLEGQNGIGKTSLVNVAIFRALEHFMEDKVNYPLFVPCHRTFQLTEGTNAEDFIDEVLLEASQSIIKHYEDLRRLGVLVPESIDDLNQWLNDAHTKAYQITAGPIGGGYSKELNTGQGFARSGFRLMVRHVLERMFPISNNGGIVCIIDNLELIQKSHHARQILEDLRDRLFSFQGLRWVICGSRGIVTSLVASPRLDGLLHNPIEVQLIEERYIYDILYKRVEVFRESPKSYLPITHKSFKSLYAVLMGNIRGVLKYANEYCTWIADEQRHPLTNEEKERAFDFWLEAICNGYLNEVGGRVKPRSLAVFGEVARLGSPRLTYQDYAQFGLTSYQAFLAIVKELEKYGLLESVIDEDEGRRRIIQITAKGWFLSYAMPEAFNSPTRTGEKKS